MEIKTKVDCICCGSNSHVDLYKNLTSVYNVSVHGYSLEQCINCGNIRTKPAPSQSDLTLIYNSLYLYDVHKLIIGEKKYRALGLMKTIHRYLPSSKKILEIGCNYGYLLEELKKKYNVFGIELDENAVSYCQQKNLKVVQDNIEHFAKTTDKKFDLIIMSHVFEHLLNPDEVLANLRKILSKEGQVLILVPNSKSFTAKTFKKYWGWWQVPVHINHFNRNSLTLLLDKCNFQTIKTTSKGGDSLIIILSLMNIFKSNKSGNKLSPIKRFIIIVNSIIFRYWYQISNEELVVLAKEKHLN
jgi:SAM-dependent methyltransferase